jgi:hypothetical protein
VYTSIATKVFESRKCPEAKFILTSIPRLQAVEAISWSQMVLAQSEGIEYALLERAPVPSAKGGKCLHVSKKC